jgi:hypothetical protein
VFDFDQLETFWNNTCFLDTVFTEFKYISDLLEVKKTRINIKGFFDNENKLFKKVLKESISLPNPKPEKNKTVVDPVTKWKVVLGVLDKWSQEKRENWMEVKKLLQTLYIYKPDDTESETKYYNLWKEYLNNL